MKKLFAIFLSFVMLFTSYAFVMPAAAAILNGQQPASWTCAEWSNGTYDDGTKTLNIASWGAGTAIAPNYNSNGWKGFHSVTVNFAKELPNQISVSIQGANGTTSETKWPIAGTKSVTIKMGEVTELIYIVFKAVECTVEIDSIIFNYPETLGGTETYNITAGGAWNSEAQTWTSVSSSDSLLIQPSSEIANVYSAEVTFTSQFPGQNIWMHYTDGSTSAGGWTSITGASQTVKFAVNPQKAISGFEFAANGVNKTVTIENVSLSYIPQNIRIENTTIPASSLTSTSSNYVPSTGALNHLGNGWSSIYLDLPIEHSLYTDVVSFTVNYSSMSTATSYIRYKTTSGTDAVEPVSYGTASKGTTTKTFATKNPVDGIKSVQIIGTGGANDNPVPYTDTINSITLHRLVTDATVEPSPEPGIEIINDLVHYGGTTGNSYDSTTHTAVVNPTWSNIRLNPSGEPYSLENLESITVTLKEAVANKVYFYFFSENNGEKNDPAAEYKIPADITGINAGATSATFNITGAPTIGNVLKQIQIAGGGFTVIIESIKLNYKAANVVRVGDKEYTFDKLTEALAASLLTSQAFTLLDDIDFGTLPATMAPIEYEGTTYSNYNIDLNGHTIKASYIDISAATIINNSSAVASTITCPVNVNSNLTLSGAVNLSDIIVENTGAIITNDYTGNAAVSLATPLIPGDSKTIAVGTGSFDGITSANANYEVTRASDSITFTAKTPTLLQGTPIEITYTSFSSITYDEATSTYSFNGIWSTAWFNTTWPIPTDVVSVTFEFEPLTVPVQLLYQDGAGGEHTGQTLSAGAQTATLTISDPSAGVYYLGIKATGTQGEFKLNSITLNREVEPAAAVGEELFATVGEAIVWATQNGGTVTLLADAEVANGTVLPDISVNLNGFDVTLGENVTADSLTLEGNGTVFGNLKVNTALNISGGINVNVTLADGAKIAVNNHTGDAVISLETPLNPSESREVLAGIGSFTGVSSADGYDISTSEAGVTFTNSSTEPYVDINKLAYGYGEPAPVYEGKTVTFNAANTGVAFKAYNSANISNVIINYDIAGTTATSINVSISYNDNENGNVETDEYFAVPIENGQITVEVKKPVETINTIQFQLPRDGVEDSTLTLNSIELFKSDYELVSVPNIDGPDGCSMAYDSTIHVATSSADWQSMYWNNLSDISSITFNVSNLSKESSFWSYIFLEGGNVSTNSTATQSIRINPNTSADISYTVADTPLQAIKFAAEKANTSIKINYITFTLNNGADIYVISRNKAIVFESNEEAINYITELAEPVTIGLNANTQAAITVTKDQDITLNTNGNSFDVITDESGNPTGGFIIVDGGKLTLTNGAGDIYVGLMSGNVLNATSTFTGTAHILTEVVPDENNRAITIVKGENLSADNFASLNPNFVVTKEGYDIVIKKPVALSIPKLNELVGLNPAEGYFSLTENQDGTTTLNWEDGTHKCAVWKFSADALGSKGILGLKINLNSNSAGQRMGLRVYYDGVEYAADPVRQEATPLNGTITFDSTVFTNPEKAIKEIRLYNFDNADYIIDSIEFVMVEAPSMYSYALELKTDLAIIYYAKADPFTSGLYTNPVALIDVNGVFAREILPITDNNGEYNLHNGYLQFKFEGIAPANIDDTHTVIIRSTAPDGSIAYSSPVSASIKNYCEDNMNNAVLSSLLKSILNYGTAAQNYHYENDDSTMNSTLSEQDREILEPFENVTVFGCKNEVNNANATAQLVNTSLTLNDSIALNFFFTVAESDISSYTAKIKYHGGEVEISAEDFIISGNRYRVKFNSMSAAHLSKPVEITLYNGNTPVSNTYTYSVLDYAYEAIKYYQSNPNKVRLVKALKTMVKYIADVDNYVVSTHQGEKSTIEGMNTVYRNLGVNSLVVTDGFVTVSGTTLNLNGKEFLIQSMGLENDVQKGYTDTASILGVQHTAETYSELKEAGFNTAKLYLNYEMFEVMDANGNFIEFRPGPDEDTDATYGFGWIQRNVEWAEAAGMKLIISMYQTHGGYQSLGKNYKLWADNDKYGMQDRYVNLWGKIAEYFSEEETIIAYGLMNEPMPAVFVNSDNVWSDQSISANSASLCNQAISKYQSLVSRAAQAIRAVDDNHIIISERVYAVNVFSTVELTNGNVNGRGIMYTSAGTYANDTGNFVKLLNENGNAISNVMYEFHSYAPSAYSHYMATWDNKDYIDYHYNGDLLYFVSGGNKNNTDTGTNGGVGNTYTTYDSQANGNAFAIGIQASNLTNGSIINVDNLELMGYNSTSGKWETVYSEDFQDAVEQSQTTISNVNMGTDSLAFANSVTESYIISGNTKYLQITYTGTESSVELASLLAFTPDQGALAKYSKFKFKADIWSSNSSVSFTPTITWYTDATVTAFDKEYLENTVSGIDQFQNALNAPIFVGEFGTMNHSFKADAENGNREYNGAQYVKDLISIYKDKKFGFSYHAYYGGIDDYGYGFGMYTIYNSPIDPVNGTYRNNALYDAFKAVLLK